MNTTESVRQSLLAFLLSLSSAGRKVLYSKKAAALGIFRILDSCAQQLVLRLIFQSQSVKRSIIESWWTISYQDKLQGVINELLQLSLIHEDSFGVRLIKEW